MQIPLSTFFESPEKWEGQEIATRGFLYQKEGKTVLASEPGIPSCCLGKESKPYLVLQGEFPAIPSKATLVEGRIIKESPFWIMAGPKFAEDSSFTYEPLVLVFVLLVLLMGKKFYIKDRLS